MHDPPAPLCLPPPTTLLQVPMSITREQLGGLFSNYGTVTDVNIMTPKKPGAMGGYTAAARGATVAQP
jgi:hypothetical protein